MVPLIPVAEQSSTRQAQTGQFLGQLRGLVQFSDFLTFAGPCSMSLSSDFAVITSMRSGPRTATRGRMCAYRPILELSLTRSNLLSSSVGRPAAKIPFLGLNGDFQSGDPYEAYAALLRSLGGDATSIHLPELGIFGNGHTMAIEKNNEQIADVIEKWIVKHTRSFMEGRRLRSAPFLSRVAVTILPDLSLSLVQNH